MTDLEFHASGFVAKVGGTWTDTALEQFRDYLTKIGILTSEDDLHAVIENAKEKFWQGDCRVFSVMRCPATGSLFLLPDTGLSAMTRY